MLLILPCPGPSWNVCRGSYVGTGAGICKYQREIQWHISLGQDVTAFQADVAAILDCVTSCLRKRLVKEQTTICTDSKVAVAALGVSGTKTLFVADCTKKLTALLEVNKEPQCGYLGIAEFGRKRLQTGQRGRELGPDLSNFSRFNPKK